jgi:hypothetical protein
MLLPTVSTEKGTSKKEYLSVHIVGSLVHEFYAATEMMLGHNGMKKNTAHHSITKEILTEKVEKFRFLFL